MWRREDVDTSCMLDKSSFIYKVMESPLNFLRKRLLVNMRLFHFIILKMDLISLPVLKMLFVKID